MLYDVLYIETINPLEQGLKQKGKEEMMLYSWQLKPLIH